MRVLLYSVKKIAHPLLLILFVINPILANAQEELNATPALWLIEKENSKTYFLGSIHLLPRETKWYGGLIEEVITKADEVVFEVNMTPEKEAQAQRITLENGMLSGGDLLSNHLTEEEYSFLVERASASGIPPTSIASFKPWFASIALSVSAIIKEGWDPSSGVDKFIQKIATDRNIRISELETLESQMQTLWDHPIEIQIEMLTDTLDQLRDIKGLTLDMVNSWANGDIDQMEETFLEPMKEQPEIFAKLVVERNGNWIPVIEGLMNKDQTTLIVAGTAHFIGEDGVLRLLGDAGYNVKRVQ